MATGREAVHGSIRVARRGPVLSSRRGALAQEVEASAGGSSHRRKTVNQRLRLNCRMEAGRELREQVPHVRGFRQGSPGNWSDPVSLRRHQE